MNRRATRISKRRDFHFQGIHWKRADSAAWLAMAILFVFLVLTGTIEQGAVAGGTFIMGWLAAKSGEKS
jgi:hypothetical protein